MLDPVITEFFSKRKEGWLKKHLKAGQTAFEEGELMQQCEAEFSLDNWLPKAARRAGQMSISTHPCTFSHPSARKNKAGYVTPVVATAPRIADGYLRTGNVQVQYDALGNAAALDVYKFLMLITEDGRTVMEHIQKNTELAQGLLSVKTAEYEELRMGFMAMISPSQTAITSSKIKQVYFPVGRDYHQLSILSNSGVVFELRDRVNDLRFSERAKTGRELRRKNSYSEFGYSEIYNIATIGYGGTKPQNISVLNNQFGGKAHLLCSIPPTLEKSYVAFPTHDFFVQKLRYRHFKKEFILLDKIFKMQRNRRFSLDEMRQKRDSCLDDIFGLIIEKQNLMREISAKNPLRESSKLPEWQKIWLCERHQKERLEGEEWLTTLCNQLQQWIGNAYEKSVKNPVLLGAAELHHISQYVTKNKEDLR